ncbi:hypothetical protein WJX74_003512 [Apatococcus lobatus]|uniref:Ribosomal RNA methyltransferase FtsJ domain-containing protein n=1 Tax=Apatococcus lobatus TaxID=904363 RepID=A0AAW1RP51_9CHLO
MASVYLQSAASQAQCFRLTQLHKDKSLKYFPCEDFGTEAVEVVPGQLVKLIGVKTDHASFLSWFRISQVSRHFPRAFWCTGCVQLTSIKGGFAYDALLAVLQQETLQAQPVRLTCFPRKMEQAIGEKLVAGGWFLDPHSYQTVLAVVEVDGQVEWGLYPRHLHYLQQPDEPSRLPAGCSHAVGKLAEAVDAIGWDMSQVKLAVDLGAAPGSWTSFMAKSAKRVLAVDPASMDDSLLALHNVVHLQTRAPEDETRRSGKNVWNAGWVMHLALLGLFGFWPIQDVKERF